MICKHCNKEFKAKRVTALYCSDTCKHKQARLTDPPAVIDVSGTETATETLSGTTLAGQNEQSIISGTSKHNLSLEGNMDTITLSDGQQFTPSIKGYVSRLDMQYGVLKGEVSLGDYRKKYPQEKAA